MRKLRNCYKIKVISAFAAMLVLFALYLTGSLSVDDPLICMTCSIGCVFAYTVTANSAGIYRVSAFFAGRSNNLCNLIAVRNLIRSCCF